MIAEGDELRSVLDAQLRMIEDLGKRLAYLESEVSGSPSGPTVCADKEAGPSYVKDAESAGTRRGFLRLAGVSAAGVVLAAVANQEPVAATDNLAVLQGVNNTGTLQTTVTNGVASSPDTAALKGVGATNNVGLYGQASGSAAAGVQGFSDTGFGVYGTSGSGYSLFAGGIGRIGMAVHLPGQQVPPTSSSYQIGDIVLDFNGGLAVCVATGSPGMWRKLAGPTTAGQLHLLPVPLRAYDSRPGEPAATGGDGPIFSNGSTVSPTTRIVSLLNGTDNGVVKPAVPSGALGAMFNLTTAGTVNAGYLSVVAGGAAWSRSSTSNWGATNQSVAGYVTSAVNASAQISVICPLNSTHFLIDVIGYYR